MIDKKITLEELAKLGGAADVDLNEFTDKNVPHRILKEEITDFISNKRRKATPSIQLNSCNVPNSDLKSEIEKLIKPKNLQGEIERKKAQYDFDVKMSRINKIKSKTYRRLKRKDKLKRMAQDASNEDGEGDEGTASDEGSNDNSEDSIHKFEPVINLDQNIKLKKDSLENTDSPLISKVNKEQFDLVASVFDSFEDNMNECEFLKDKMKIVEAEKPKILEDFLPGWGDWAGAGLEAKRTESNTKIQIVPGIKIDERKDYKMDNVIVNENIVFPKKYLSVLPFKMTEDAYNTKMRTAISAETTSARAFNKFLKTPKNDETPYGKNIEPTVFNFEE